jgi:hypothetical protein
MSGMSGVFGCSASCDLIFSITGVVPILSLWFRLLCCTSYCFVLACEPVSE